MNFMRRWLRKKQGIIVLATICFAGIFIFFQTSYEPSRSSVCNEKNNIVFLKTHKCAGSAIQNILMRYGDARNLSFVLPEKANYLGHPEPFNRSQIMHPQLKTYNILTHHTRFNYTSIKSVTPNDTVFVTILREPVELFESFFYYYGLDLHFKSLQNFLAFVEKFKVKRIHKKFAFNQMMFDLGADTAIFSNEDLTFQYIKKLESWFDLVMIANRMDESLVLLRHLMCWGIDDVVVFKVNARISQFKTTLSDKHRDALNNLNHADVKLYNHFLEMFEMKVKAFGYDNMASEVSELQKRIKQWYDLCVDTKYSDEQKKRGYHNPRVVRFSPKGLRNESCSKLIMDELVFTETLRKKQKRNFKNN